MNRVVLGVVACLSFAGCALGRSPVATTWVLDPVATRAVPSAAPGDAGVLSVERVDGTAAWSSTSARTGASRSAEACSA
jgi:hypothetical protein